MQYTRWLCLGDSITFGARTRFGRTYPTLLEERLSTHPVPAVCINAGINGQRSYEIVDRAWDHLSTDDWIRGVICLMGTNDSKPAGRTPIQHYFAQWNRLLRYCTYTDVHLLAVEVPYLDATGQPEYDAESDTYISQVNLRLADWCRANDIPLVPTYEQFRESPTLLADGVHPNESGNEAIAAAIHNVLRLPLPAKPRSMLTWDGESAQMSTTG